MGLTGDLVVALPAWLVACAVALGQSAVQAQPAVRSAHLAAHVSLADGGASVTLQYELIRAADLETVDLELLGFGEATADEVTVAGVERFRLAPTSGSRRSASLQLSPAGDGARRRVVLEYRVRSAVELRGEVVRVRIPLVTMSLPPVNDSPALFTATLELPQAWRVAEGFPSSLREREPGVYIATLPVVPSVVGLRARTDGAWRPGVALLVELLAGLVMAWIVAAGWRYLRAVSE